MAGSSSIIKSDVHTRRLFRAFENRGYFCLWLANCLLYTARWMQMTLLAWLILDLTNSPWLVALVGFFSSAPMFLLGSQVQRGLHGEAPTLTDLDNGNLKYTLDFRSVYASVLEQWMGAPADAILGDRFERLALLKPATAAAFASARGV